MDTACLAMVVAGELFAVTSILQLSHVSRNDSPIGSSVGHRRDIATYQGGISRLAINQGATGTADIELSRLRRR